MSTIQFLMAFYGMDEGPFLNPIPADSAGCFEGWPHYWMPTPFGRILFGIDGPYSEL